MKALIAIILIIIAVLVISISLSPEANLNAPTVNNNELVDVPVEVMPITHATFILGWGDKVIYADPTGGAFTFNGKPAANIVLVTDIHGDHLSTSTLNAVVGSSTLIVPQAVKDLLPANLASQAIILANGQTVTEQGFKITGVPMYNLPVTSDSRHVKGRGNGYIIEKDGYRVYIAGDTSATPEMRALTDIDMAFVPMNPPFTMNVDEAASGVLSFKPKIVYPFHYRGQDGLSDVNKFKQLVNDGNKDIQVILANWYPGQ